MERNPDHEIAQIEQSLEKFVEREMGVFPENQPVSGWQKEADRPYHEGVPQKQQEPQAYEPHRELQADMLLPKYRQSVHPGAEETPPESGPGREPAYCREEAELRGEESRRAPHQAETVSARSGQSVARRREKAESGEGASRRPALPQSAGSGTGRTHSRQAVQDGAVRKRPAAGTRPVREEDSPAPGKRSRPAAGKKNTRARRKQEQEDRYEDDYEYDYEDEYEDDPDEDDTRKTPPVRRKKKKRRNSRLKRLLIALLLICLLIGGLWYYAVGRIYTKMTYHEIDSLVSEPMKEDGVINILLIGNDSREAGEDGRSDAMILLSVSSRTKTIHMMSLLRDMYVDIPGRQGNRLNAAYAFGGPELLMETLEQNLDLEVNRYVQVNFQAFANLVDAVGGVDLELSNEEVQYVNGYLTEYNNLEGRAEGTDYLDFGLSGMIHLNGPQALAYCRIRYIGSDFGRTERQRKVLSEVIRQAPKAVLTNPSGLINGLLPNLTTNLTEAECRELSLQALSLLRYDIVQSSIPIQGSYSNASIRGMSVLDVDFEANKAFIRQNIYGE